jgi:hypothetical protein
MTVQTFRGLLTKQLFQPFRLIIRAEAHLKSAIRKCLVGTDMLVGVGETDEGVPAEFRICSCCM